MRSTPLPACVLFSCMQATLLQLTRLDCTQFPKEALHNRPALLRDFVVTGKVKVGQLPFGVPCQCRAGHCCMRARQLAHAAAASRGTRLNVWTVPSALPAYTPALTAHGEQVCAHSNDS